MNNEEELAKLIAEVEDLQERADAAFEIYWKLDEELSVKLELLEAVNKHNKQNDVTIGEIVDEQ